jgi:hypothetical protein
MLGLEQPLSPEQRTLLAPRIAQFYRALELQNRRDSEIVASLVRVLTQPRSADAEQFVELLRGVMDSKGD